MRRARLCETDRGFSLWDGPACLRQPMASAYETGPPVWNRPWLQPMRRARLFETAHGFSLWDGPACVKQTVASAYGTGPPVWNSPWLQPVRWAHLFETDCGFSLWDGPACLKQTVASPYGTGPPVWNRPWLQPRGRWYDSQARYPPKTHFYAFVSLPWHCATCANISLDYTIVRYLPQYSHIFPWFYSSSASTYVSTITSSYRLSNRATIGIFRAALSYRHCLPRRWARSRIYRNYFAIETCATSCGPRPFMATVLPLSMFHWRLLRDCYCFILNLFSLRLFHFSFIIYIVLCVSYFLLRALIFSWPTVYRISQVVVY
jgi:hypothetical protein